MEKLFTSNDFSKLLIAIIRQTIKTYNKYYLKSSKLFPIIHKILHLYCIHATSLYLIYFFRKFLFNRLTIGVDGKPLGLCHV